MTASACPVCSSEDTRGFGAFEAIPGVDDWDGYVMECDACGCEWEREKGGPGVWIFRERTP